MPQLHLYVTDATADLLRADAEVANLSLSRYMAKLLTDKAHQGWPEGYFDSVCGSCPDFEIPEDVPGPAIEPWDRTPE